MAEPIGASIRARRIGLAIRRKQLAAMVGKSYEHIANIENGHTTAAPETLVDIATALDMRIEDVMVSSWVGAEKGKKPREANPTSHPEPKAPVPPPPPRRKNGAKKSAAAS